MKSLPAPTTTPTIHEMIERGEDTKKILELINSANLPKHLSESLKYLASNRRSSNRARIRHTSNTKKALRKTTPTERMSIGRALLAPILHTFYKRLLARLAVAQRTDGEQLDLFFLAREGYLLKKGFDRIINECNLRNARFGTHYLLASRAMLSKAAFHLRESHDLIARHQYKGSFRSFFASRLGIEDAEIRAAAFKHPFLNEPYNYTRLRKAFEVAAAEFNFIDESRTYLDYLESIGFTKSSLKIVIDLGYSGTIQDLLSLIAPGKIQGYYLITTPSATSSINASSTNAKHGLVASGVSWGSCSLLDKSILLEALLTSPDGSCLGVKNIDKEFIFRYGPTCSTQDRFDEIQDIFDKAMDHVILMLMHDLEELDYHSLSSLYSSVLSTSYFSRSNIAITSLFEIEDNYGGNTILDVSKIISQ